MVKSATSNTAERRPFSEDEFKAWLPEDRHTRVALRRDQGQWSALFMEFNIVGIGDSSEAALRQAETHLWAHLQFCFAEGLSFGNARKPIPKLAQLRYELSPHLARVRRGLSSFREIRETSFDAGFAGHIPHPTL